MKQVFINTWFLLFCMFFVVKGFGQPKIFDGLFEKEEPKFHSNILPTSEKGSVKIALYFTHSKINDLELSFWIKDLGTTLMENGDKQLVTSLQSLGNRQQDTITISGLNHQRFYSIGIDYRRPSSISSRFNSKVLKEGYRYFFEEKEVAKIPEKKSTTNIQKQELSPPCYTPEFFTRLESSGYCENYSRPAIQIHCTNCEGQNWTFSLEYRDSKSNWKTLRVDGQRQSAMGNTVRTEPLCLLPPGIYDFRALAWGPHCSTPKISKIPVPIIIPEEKPRVAEASVFTAKSAPLPTSCQITGQATLKGNIISGTLDMPKSSACSQLNPFAKVRYVHPGYRDIEVEAFPLIEDGQAFFEIHLDQRDLNRGVHPIQVTSLVNADASFEGEAVDAIWINVQGTPRSQTYIDDNPIEVTIATPVEEKSQPIPSNMDDCNDQIKDLRLVYDSKDLGRPLFLSWLSPECCQQSGCSYTVWTGKAPDQLSLFVKGQKTGKVIRELLEGTDPQSTYFEVEVNTGKSVQKAAYILGEGPKYGVNEIVAFRNQKEEPNKTAVSFESRKPSSNKKSKLSVMDFSPCKYKRQTDIIGDNPIHEGDEVTIKYAFKDKGYHYSLYLQPAGTNEWMIAPGTRELKSKPEFKLDIEPKHAGKYLILIHKASSGWGCLSSSMDEALELRIAENR